MKKLRVLPWVETLCKVNVLKKKRLKRQVFPTPESPRRRIFDFKEGLREV